MPNDPNEIAELGNRIYSEKFKAEYERLYPGQFVVIDINAQTATVKPSPEEALKTALAGNPKGPFHLVRIGSPGVFRVSYSSPKQKHGRWFAGR